MLSPQVLSLINLSTLYKTPPSKLLEIDDPYVAYCLDETCLYMINQARDKREPNFDLPKRRATRRTTTNSDALEQLKALGAHII